MPRRPGPRSTLSADGRLLGGRYRLVECLGGGAHGEVWAVDDEVVGERVALKWIRPAPGASLARVLRESATLRMLRMPGVVRFIDDGVEDGRPFIVMELVTGRPFPGLLPARSVASPHFSWEEISGVALALLEILSRVHAAGVVHRDLKPDNILVSADGGVTILDFGISYLSETGNDRHTRAGQILGTPRYMAPEQLLRLDAGTPAAVDARADLHAVGIMLYEALAGRAPHEISGTAPRLDIHRRLQPAPRIRDVAPDLPKTVADVVDRLISPLPESRFRSAAETIAALRGEAPAARPETTLPWLGSDRPIEAAVHAVMEGRSIDVVGPPGSGRTRCLQEVARRLTERGRPVVWTDPVRSPFVGLQMLIGPPPERPSSRLATVTAWAEKRVRPALRRGTVVLVDDVENTDAESLGVLDRCRRGPGVIVRALPEVPAGAAPGSYILLEPLDEVSLRPLFAGTDRLFHVREDAARALWERTEGRPGRIEAEVSLWVRLGIARREGGLLAVGRGALARLGAGLLGVVPASSAQASSAAEPHLVKILWWLAIGGHPVDLRQLAAAMEEPLWRVESGCEELVRRGAARWTGALCIAPLGQMDTPWTEDERAAAHRAVAKVMRPGQEGRLFHLISADLTRASVKEAVVLGRRRAGEGNHTGAAVALE